MSSKTDMAEKLHLSAVDRLKTSADRLKTSADRLKVTATDRTHGRRDDFQTAIQPYMNSSPTLTNIQRLCANAFASKTTMVRINVNGTIFALPRTTAIRIPALRPMLPSAQNARSQKVKKGTLLWGMLSASRDVLCFERNATVFAAVVDYVQNDELHAPHDICPKLFARELNFWGFDIDLLEPCCFAGVVHFLYEQERLCKFHGFLHNRSPGESGSGGSAGVSGSNEGEAMTCCHTFAAFRTRCWTVLDEPFSGRLALIYFWVMSIIILGSYLTISLGTHSYFKEKGSRAARNLFICEHTCLTFLYFDYVCRIICYPKPMYFWCDFINVTDGVASLSSLFQLASEMTGLLENREGQIYVHIVDILQLLRILRLLRPMSKLTGFRLIYYTVKCSFRELLLVLMLLIFLAMFFSSLLYYLGDRQSINSIPDAMWFSIITMTTVGYGDIVPKDWRTMIIGSVVAVFGIVMMSMTTPIMVSNFHTLYINAVVGQPNTIKKAYQCLDKCSSGSLDKKTSSGGNKLAPPRRKITKTLDAEQQGGPGVDNLAGRSEHVLSKTQTCCVMWCGCCGNAAEVQPVDECAIPQRPWEHQQIDFEAKMESVHSVRRRTNPEIQLSTSEASANSDHQELDACEGFEADRESEGGITDSGDPRSPQPDDQREFNKTILERHQGLIRPKHRTWFANYDASTDADSEKDDEDTGQQGGVESDEKAEKPKPTEDN